MWGQPMFDKFSEHKQQQWVADVDNVETHLQTNIDENVLEFLVLLIEADMELRNSHQIGRVV